MTDQPWQLAESEARQLRLLEWLAERSAGSLIPGVGPFYDDDEERDGQARSDVEALDLRGWVLTAVAGGGLGGISATPNATGLAVIEELRQRRQDKPTRRRAARSALLSWLYDQDAIETPDRAITWDGLFTDTRSLFYGEAFSVSEVQQAAAWLQRHKLIDGPEVAEVEGPLMAYLLDAGVRCVERFKADATGYVEQMERPAEQSATVTWNVTGEHVQVATGDKARQVMNIGANVEQIALALTGMVELLRAAGVEVGEDVEQLRDEAVADVKSEKPTGQPTKAFMAKVRALLVAGASPPITAAITAGTNALIEDVEHLVHAIGMG